MRTTDYDRIGTSAPLDAQASIVRDGGGDQWEPECSPGYLRWLGPPTMKPIGSLSAPGQQIARGLVGHRFGQLLVLGVFADGNPKKPATWVVRCDCGYYEGRKAKSLQSGAATACYTCDKVAQMRTSRKNTGAERAKSSALLDRLAGGAR